MLQLDDIKLLAGAAAGFEVSSANELLNDIITRTSSLLPVYNMDAENEAVSPDRCEAGRLLPNKP